MIETADTDLAPRSIERNGSVATQAEDSLRKRYLYKLSTNVIGLLISLATQAIIPRALGPAAYGSFSFLTDFFSRVIGFFDASTSIGFYTKLSQRPKEPGLVRFYWGFAGVVGCLLFAFVLAASAAGLRGSLWPGQEAGYVWMAAIWALLTWCSQISSYIVDAYGLTVGGEIARMTQKALALVLVVLMFSLQWLRLTQFFAYNYVVIIVLILAWWRILAANDVSLYPSIRLPIAAIKGYVAEFYEYSSPLFATGVFTLLFGVLDRWLLQRVAGSVEQGFYGLSYQIGTICFLFTGAMTPLFVREFSKAFGNEDTQRMRSLFQRYIPMLYSIAAFFSVFVALQAGRISVIFGGDRFREAALPISIMALYPIHQTYGQLSGSVFFATGQTKVYRNLSIGVGLLGLPLTFWLLGPSNWWGLNLGAAGLAFKMVLVQFIGVSLQLWYNTRLLHLSFWKFLWHQIYSIVLMTVTASLATVAVDRVIHPPLLALLATGCLYALGVASIAFLFPQMFATTRRELVISLAQVLALARTVWSD